ncbi:hypothetical protein Bca4012_081531 [Brassica carinata]|uniref:Uncharacterized protein n=1 Tax=Brassica carinata TaxID=52824 RepID=A0A8X7RB97_BRACI|nr:hypothetical protein Bca52824_044765 [Brassica carinata]
MAEQVVYIQNEADRTRRCTKLGKYLDGFAKQLYDTIGANVAVFARSDRGRVYQYSSPLPGGLDDVMDRLGYTPTMEFDLLGKLRRDSDPLELGGRSMIELAGLESRLVSAMEAIEVALANLE